LGAPFRRVQQGLPGGDPADGVDQVVTADLLEHVSGGAGHDRGEQGLVILVRGQDQPFDRGIDRPFDVRRGEGGGTVIDWRVPLNGRPASR
jgi:hypothetical protein